MANKLTTPHTFKVELASTNESTGFDGTADIHDIGVDGLLQIANGGTNASTAAGARANLGTWALVSDSYNTIMPADGTTNAWYKFGTSNTSYGILPSASGGATAGHNYIGTSSWYWKYSYIDEMNATRLRVVNDSSNTSDDALVYIQNKTASDWALNIVKGGKDYGLRVDSLDQGNAIWTNGYVRARCVWANQGSNGERQVGVDSGTAGTLYLWSNTTDKGIYSSTGYRTGYIIRILSGSTTFYGNCTGSSGSCTGNAASATKVGYSAHWLYAENSDEVNFGGTHTGATIYFGYRARDSRPKPTNFNFGNSTASLTCDGVHGQYIKAKSGNVTMISANGHVLAMQTDCNLVVYRNGNSAAWSTGTSSRLIKKNIKTITSKDLENFKKLNPVSFNYIDEVHWINPHTQLGLIAEEVLELYPGLVTVPDEFDIKKFDASKGMNQPLMRLNYDGFIPLLIKMVQNQQNEIDKLKLQLEKLTK